MAQAFLNALAKGQQIGQNLQETRQNAQLRNALAQGNRQQAFAANPEVASSVINSQTAARGQDFREQQAQQQQVARQAVMQAKRGLEIGRMLEGAETEAEKRFLLKHYKPELEKLAGGESIPDPQTMTAEQLEETIQEFRAEQPKLKSTMWAMSDPTVRKQILKGEQDKTSGTLVTLEGPNGETVTRRRDSPEVDQLIQRGYQPADDPGGTLVTLRGPDGRTVTRRRDSAEVDQLLNQGFTEAPSRQQIEQGEPGAFAGGKTEIRQLRDKQSAARSFVETAGDAIDLLQENPDINTFTGQASALINDLQQEAKALARNSGFEIESKVLEDSTYSDSFDRLGIDNRRMRSMITALAFKAAAASGQTGRGVSDRDVRRFIEEVGANASDPRAFAATLQDVASRTVRDVQIQEEIARGESVDRDYGLDRLQGRIEPEPEPQQPSTQPGQIQIDPETQRLMEKYNSGNR